jgi:hypothetical protein
MSERWFDTLPADLQSIVLATAQEIGTLGRSIPRTPAQDVGRKGRRDRHTFGSRPCRADGQDSRDWRSSRPGRNLSRSGTSCGPRWNARGTVPVRLRCTVTAVPVGGRPTRVSLSARMAARRASRWPGHVTDLDQSTMRLSGCLFATFEGVSSDLWSVFLRRWSHDFAHERIRDRDRDNALGLLLAGGRS